MIQERKSSQSLILMPFAFILVLQTAIVRSPVALVMCLKTVLRKFWSPGVASSTDGEAADITQTDNKKTIVSVSNCIYPTVLLNV